jgi:hypothetical protein
MKEILDGIVVVAFILFMVWIIVGYHHQKGHHKRGD